MKRFRSLLFVPGNQPEWLEKALATGADGVVLDLEDSVPACEKVNARRAVRNILEPWDKEGVPLLVRVNGYDSGMTAGDLEEVIVGGIAGVILPKVADSHDMSELDSLLQHFEERSGLPNGRIETPLCIETARSLRNVYQIAVSSPRIRSLLLSAGPGGDMARSVGYQWTKEGLETLYMRSKMIVDARAAGIDHVMIISWWDLKDLEGLRRDAERNRQLGYEGMAVVHPSHVSIVNEVFTPKAEEISYCERLLLAFEDAKRAGIGAIAFEGVMVDEAMAVKAKEMLDNFPGSPEHRRKAVEGRSARNRKSVRKPNRIERASARGKS